MDQQTIQVYNLMAKEYDLETADFWDRIALGFAEKFAAEAHGEILDVGSGPGRDALILKRKGLEVVCLDASEAMVQLCTEKGFESVLGDFSAMPFEDRTFDGAWAYTSLLHVPKSEVSKALDEISRVLKDRGILGLGMIEGSEELYRQSSDISALRWFSFYSKEEIENLLAKHGFKVLYFEQFQPKSKNYLNFIAQKQ